MSSLNKGFDKRFFFPHVKKSINVFFFICIKVFCAEIQQEVLTSYYNARSNNSFKRILFRSIEKYLIYHSYIDIYFIFIQLTREHFHIFNQLKFKIFRFSYLKKQPNNFHGCPDQVPTTRCPILY